MAKAEIVPEIVKQTGIETNEGLASKPFVVIDLGSGSFCVNNEGHEKYNEVRNEITGRYYGYCPPRGGLNIKELDAKSDDDRVDNVLVIYVKKKENSSDRVITSFIENATVYADFQIDKKLKRLAITHGEKKHCGYCIESDELTKISDIPGAKPFTIHLADYSTHMFRMQRFYKGKYPALDSMMIDYLENLSAEYFENDDLEFQGALQEDGDITKANKQNHKEEPQYSDSRNGRQVAKKAAVSKASLQEANYMCSGNPLHVSFINKTGYPYMEGHHLILCTAANASYYWAEYGVNIDCIENIVCLCPTCHRQIHYGADDVRLALLKDLYKKQKERLKSIGIDIDFKTLKALYGL